MDVSKTEKHVEVYVVDRPLTTKEDQPPNIISEKRPYFHIDKAMVRYKFHYFLMESAFSLTSPFVPLFAKNQVGLSATALATIMTTHQFLFIFSKPLICYAADYFNKLKAIIFILLLTQGFVFFLFLFIPKIGFTETIINQRLSLDETNELSLRYQRCQLDRLNKTKLTAYNRTVTDIVCSIGGKAKVTFPNECFLSIINKTKQSFLDKLEDNLPVSPIDFPRSECDLQSVVETICTNCCNSISDTCFALTCEQSGNVDTTSPTRSQYLTYSFWMFAVFSTVTRLCTNTLFTLSDTALCERAHITGSDIGRQQLWAAVGWGVMSPVGGLLIDFFDGYLVSFLVNGVFTALSLWNLHNMEIVKPLSSQNLLKDSMSVFRSGEFLVFQMGVFLSGIGFGVLLLYITWFVTTIGGTKFLCGLVQTVECFAGEVPFMFFSVWIVNKIGHTNVLTLALMGYSIRLFSLSFVENPWLVLPIEILHGLSYGLLYPSVASYAKKSAKPGTEATTQSILFATHEGLGAGIGCVLAGIGFDQLGGHKTFFIAGVCIAFGMVINVIFSLCLPKKRGKTLAPDSMRCQVKTTKSQKGCS